MRGMRKLRGNLPNRVYHLISRVAHRAFFLNAEERTRFVELLKRVAAFSGVDLLAYCVMTNHVHILVFVSEPKSVPALRREWKDRNGPMRPVELRDALGIASRSYFTLKYLSPLVVGGYIAPVDKDSPSSSRRAYKLTRKGKEAAQW